MTPDMPLTATSSASLKQRLTEDGFCVIPEFLDEQEVAALRAATRSYPDELQHRTASNYIVDWDGPGRIQQIYQTTGVPESWVLDREGVIVKKVIGATEWDHPAQKALFRRLLGVSSAPARDTAVFGGDTAAAPARGQ